MVLDFSWFMLLVATWAVRICLVIERQCGAVLNKAICVTSAQEVRFLTPFAFSKSTKLTVVPKHALPTAY